MSADSKAFLLVLRGHVEGCVRSSLFDTPQYSYRPGMDTNNAILRAVCHCRAVRQLPRQAIRNRTSRIMGALPPELHGGLLISLDMYKAFDSVPRKELFMAMLEANVEGNMARLIMQVHLQTIRRVRHAGQEGSCGMSRGLRQGCPIAPILYAAWSGRMCRKLMSKLGTRWCSTRLSMFADDVLGFWELPSIDSLKRAMSDLGIVLQTLQESGVTINAEKSAAILGLTGAKKARCMRAYAELAKQRLRLKVENLETVAHSPLVEVIPYLGVQLSYGLFESQTVQHRIDKAVARFNTFAPTANSALVTGFVFTNVVCGLRCGMVCFP